MQIEAEVLCIYGFDEALEPKEGQVLLFFEEEGHSLKTALQKNPQKKVVILPKKNPEELFKKLAWEYVFVPFRFQETREDTNHVLQKMAFYQMGVQLAASDFRDWGLAVVSNTLKNLSKLQSSKSAVSLFGAFPGIPAVVCGAGPSLEKELENLKAIQDQVLIFAGGSALNVLAKAGITPHFGAALDPEPPKIRHKGQTSFSVPFFYPWRVSKELLHLVKGPLLWVPPTEYYPLEKWLIEKYHFQEQPFEGGWNVGTYCLALAQALGCGPIYLVGMDLAFTDGRVYADGVVEEKEREGSVPVKNSEGKEIWTRKDWFMAAAWIEDFARFHPDLQLINATEGGLGFHNLPKGSLKDIPHSSRNLRQMTTALIASLPAMTTQDSKPILDELRLSWKRCEGFCEKMLACFQKYYPESPEEKGDYALAEVEFCGELVFQKILEPAWNIWRSLFDRKIEMSLGKKLNQILFLQRILKEGKRLWE